MLDGKRILIVEDEERAIKSYQFKFQDREQLKNVKVFYAMNAADAKKIIESEVLDLIYLDLRLGESSNPEGLDILKAFSKKSNIIVLSGFGDYQDECMVLGAKGYLVKPVDFTLMLQDGENLINGKPTVQQRI